MIEIINTQIIEGTTRHCDIAISDGVSKYAWSVGGLPLEGDLQTILNAREDKLWQAASVAAHPVDLYELTLKKVLKAFALVVMDEINILRNKAGLTPRTAAQIDDAIKAKLKTI